MGLLQNNMIDYMSIRGYAKKTIKLYTNCIRILAHHFMSSPLLLSSNNLYEFLLFLKNNNRSDSTLHIYYEAIKFFYSMHDMRYLVPQINFRKRPKKLPQVLNHEEIISLLNKCKDLRMKTIFCLLYSSGLRLSEVINLTINDIDYKRKTIFVRNSKNNKDRFTILSQEAEKVLREYCILNSPHSFLFFKKQNHDVTISQSCIQRQFKKLVLKAGIQKSAHVHTLRHSFATHLLENGTSIFHIMKLLGHSHIQTTLIYLHIQTNDLSRIRSPLDQLISEANQLTEQDTLFLQSA